MISIDPALPQLAALADQAEALACLPLARLALDGLPRTDLMVIATPLGARRGARATIRYSIRSRRLETRLAEIIGLTYADGSGAAAVYERWRELREDVALPAPLGYDARLKTVWIEEAPGGPLPGALAPDPLSTLLDAAARQIARIHARTSSPEAAERTDDPIAWATERIASLKASIPSLEPALAPMPLDLKVAADSWERGQPVPLHGRCHAGQWIVSGTEATLIDIEPERLGDATEDLARFRVDCAFRGWSPTFEHRVAEEFLAGYARHAQVALDPLWLRWHTVIALIERAHAHYAAGGDIPGLMRIIARLQGAHREMAGRLR